MTTYHVSTLTGRAGKCTAKKGNCPFGGDTGQEDHFDNKEEAKANQDRIMESHYGKSTVTVTQGKTYDPVKTPVENDTKLSTAYENLSKIEQHLNSKVSAIRYSLGSKSTRVRINGRTQTVYERNLEEEFDECDRRMKEYLTQSEEYLARETTDEKEDEKNKGEARYLKWKANDLKEKLEEYNEKFHEREDKLDEIAKLENVYQKHQWSRFFIVPNGHIHESMDCSTCNNGQSPTQFGWLPTLSGKTEKDAVAEHGAKLCTICYPSAPTEWTNYKEVEEARKKAESCTGSGTYDWVKGTTRFGYMAGNGGTCSHCNEYAGATPREAIRKHKAKK